MDDLISRQDAIDAIVGCTNCKTEDALRAYVTKHSLDGGWTGGIVDALDAVEELPSAQLEEDCETCKHGYFGDAQCNTCRVRFLSHYEREEARGNDHDHS